MPKSQYFSRTANNAIVRGGAAPHNKIKEDNMETIVKPEAPETTTIGATTAESIEPDPTTAEATDGTEPTAMEDTQETATDVNITDESGAADTALHDASQTTMEYVSNICNSLDSNEELSAFRAENPDTYNMLKKMLGIAVGSMLSATGIDADAEDINGDTVATAVETGDGSINADGINDEGGTNMTEQPSPKTPAEAPAGAQPAQQQAEAAEPQQSSTPAPATEAAAPAEAAAVTAAAPETQRIDRYAVPPRNVGNSSKPIGSDETFTSSEIHNFYKDVVKGRYRGREKDADAMESRIFNAVKEGRVTA